MLFTTENKQCQHWMGYDCYLAFLRVDYFSQLATACNGRSESGKKLYPPKLFRLCLNSFFHKICEDGSSSRTYSLILPLITHVDNNSQTSCWHDHVVLVLIPVDRGVIAGVDTAERKVVCVLLGIIRLLAGLSSCLCVLWISSGSNSNALFPVTGFGSYNVNIFSTPVFNVWLQQWSFDKWKDVRQLL